MGSHLATSVLLFVLFLSCMSITHAHTVAAPPPPGVAGNLTAAIVHLHEELQALDPLGCDDTCQGCLVRSGSGVWTSTTGTSSASLSASSSTLSPTGASGTSDKNGLDADYNNVRVWTS
uniref:Uncharacterized protein n=1 Tax=Oryza glumipatula TaxID=40148 RepID=A0A0E0B929_9ORYZ